MGCGVCGEVAHAAVLCPSFYRTDIVINPSWTERLVDAFRRRIIGWLGGGVAAARPVMASRPISLTLAALGGQGGGVVSGLAD